jgi:hypothetical protein
MAATSVDFKVADEDMEAAPLPGHTSYAEASGGGSPPVVAPDLSAGSAFLTIQSA